jgi:single-stranded-DNA-specific exonuclease
VAYIDVGKVEPRPAQRLSMPTLLTGGSRGKSERPDPYESKSKWNIAEPCPQDHVGYMCAAYPDISPLMAEVLHASGIDPGNLEAFLCPERPHRLIQRLGLYRGVQMQRAIERLLEAATKNEPIWIVGDSDADGLSATTILYAALTSLGANVSVYPFAFQSDNEDDYARSRLKNLKQEDAFRLLGTGAKVVITADCGAWARDFAEVLQFEGVDLIVTDHHTNQVELQSGWPSAHSTIHPLTIIEADQEDEAGVAELTGAGVAYILACSLAIPRTDRCMQIRDLCRGELQWLAALGTLSDRGTVLGLNRSLIWGGLRWLEAHARNDGKVVAAPGLRRLAVEALGNNLNRSLCADDLAIWTSSRLNAGRRFGRPDEALSLAMAQEEDDISLCLEVLGKSYRDYRALKPVVLAQAEERAHGYVQAHTGRAPAVVWMEDLAEGADQKDAQTLHDIKFNLRQSVASHLCANLNMPCIVLCKGGDTWSDSAGAEVLPKVYGTLRTPDGVPGKSVMQSSLIQPLLATQSFELSHEHSVAFQVRADAVDSLLTALGAVNEWKEAVGGIDVLSYLPIMDVTLETAECMARLEPFGKGHPEPLFLDVGVRVMSVWPSKTGEHMFMHLDAGAGRKVKANAFFMGRLTDVVRHYKRLDMVYKIKLAVDYWTEDLTVELLVVDLDVPGMTGQGE